MMVKLELEPEVQAGLLAEAQARGLSLEEYLKQVVRDHAATVPVRAIA
jgi:predicted HicB family RNase H-like nuclease